MADDKDSSAPTASADSAEKPSACPESASILADRGERRKLARRKTFRPIRVRPAHPGDGDFDEVTGTIDAHREGLYFATERKTYYKGMRLFVSMPYSPLAQGSDGEYIGEVVRVENLPDGKCGVAVHLVQSMNLKKW